MDPSYAQFGFVERGYVFFLMIVTYSQFMLILGFIVLNRLRTLPGLKFGF